MLLLNSNFVTIYIIHKMLVLLKLTIANNFISSLDNDEEYVIHSKSDNIEIMINEEADEDIK